MCGPHLGSEVGGPGEPPRGSTNGPKGGALDKWSRGVGGYNL